MNLKKTIAITLAVLTLGMPMISLRAADDNPEPKTDIVYITETGKKYHLEDCRSLKKSKIAIERAEAIEKGYEPCSICKP